MVYAVTHITLCLLVQECACSLRPMNRSKHADEAGINVSSDVIFQTGSNSTNHISCALSNLESDQFSEICVKGTLVGWLVGWLVGFSQVQHLHLKQAFV